jgi:hypothetical protein
MRAAGLEGERDGVGEWTAVGGEGWLGGSWLFHTSQCNALQLCSGGFREVETGASVGSSSYGIKIAYMSVVGWWGWRQTVGIGVILTT